MRAAPAALALFLLLPGFGAAQHQPIPYSWETPEQTERRFRRLREAEETTNAYYRQFRPSDLAECRAQGNAAFGRIEAKIAVMHDCLEARLSRRQGR